MRTSRCSPAHDGCTRGRPTVMSSGWRSPSPAGKQQQQRPWASTRPLCATRSPSPTGHWSRIRTTGSPRTTTATSGTSARSPPIRRRRVHHRGSWEAGIDGARPGFVIPADPEVGDAVFQEFSPGRPRTRRGHRDRRLRHRARWRLRRCRHDQGLDTARARGGRAQAVRPRCRLRPGALHQGRGREGHAREDVTRP